MHYYLSFLYFLLHPILYLHLAHTTIQITFETAARLYKSKSLLSSSTPLKRNISQPITLQLIIRLIVTRVHFILDTIFETECSVFDLFSRCAEFGFREAH